MTPDQQRDTALSLYRLAWRFPEQAPEPKDSSCFSDYGLAGYSSFHVTRGRLSVEACVFGSRHARIVVQGCSERRLTVEGTPDYVENMLRLIPAEMRPNVEESK